MKVPRFDASAWRSKKDSVLALIFILGIVLSGCGKSGGSSDPSPTPTPTPTPSVPSEKAFVTSTTYDGNLLAAGGGSTGLGGGDNICQQVATAAGLSGTFKAWLSDSTTNAIDRLNDVGGWSTVGLNPATLFVSKAALTTSGPLTFFTDQNGNSIGTEPWTGTQSNGTKTTVDDISGTSSNCQNWTASSGDSGVVGSGTGLSWSYDVTTASQCQNLHPVFCFQQ